MPTKEGPAPRRVVNAAAPIRICDMGGWTDTWFSGRGEVCNIAVSPEVEVQVAVFDRGDRADAVVIHAENYGHRYALRPGDPSPNRHPLLEATIDEMGVPAGTAVEISVFSEVPPGCSTGTSASVTVALVAALDRLRGGHLDAQEVAMAAHHVEVGRLGLQSGIQDQLCAAFGGISFIDMPEFPRASVESLELDDDHWSELEQRLALVFLGRSHVSSDVHRRVIAQFEDGDGEEHLQELRRAAAASACALRARDLSGFGRAMIQNTAAQQALHGDLVSAEAHRVIAIARAHGAVGWKVNGAGGEGGSMTLLCGPMASEKRRLLRALEEADPLFQWIPTTLRRTGVRVWETSGLSGSA